MKIKEERIFFPEHITVKEAEAVLNSIERMELNGKILKGDYVLVDKRDNDKGEIRIKGADGEKVDEICEKMDIKPYEVMMILLRDGYKENKIFGEAPEKIYGEY